MFLLTPKDHSILRTSTITVDSTFTAPRFLSPLSRRNERRLHVPFSCRKCYGSAWTIWSCRSSSSTRAIRRSSSPPRLTRRLIWRWLTPSSTFANCRSELFARRTSFVARAYLRVGFVVRRDCLKCQFVSVHFFLSFRASFWCIYLRRPDSYVTGILPRYVGITMEI